MLRSDCRATAELLMPPHLHVAHVIAMVRVRCFRSSTAWRWCARSSYVVLRMVEPRNVWRSMTAVSWSERVWAGALHERERSTGTVPVVLACGHLLLGVLAIVPDRPSRHGERY